MSPRRADVARFRREHEAAIHKLMPYAVGYSAALAEGDAATCDAQLDALAQVLVDDFKPKRARKAPASAPNVTPLHG